MQFGAQRAVKHCRVAAGEQHRVLRLCYVDTVVRLDCRAHLPVQS